MTDPNRDREINVALSKVSDLDSIILRPKAGSSDAKLDSKTDSERRIALLDFQELEQLIKSSPAEPLPYLQLAKIYHGQHRWKDTIRVLNAGVQINPEYEPLVVMREDLMLAAATKAVDEALEAHANQPSRDTELHLERCRVQLANEQIQFSRQRLDRHPTQHELRLLSAAGLAELHRYDEAVSQLEIAARQPSLRAAAALQLGDCYQALGRALEALSSYRVAAFFRIPPPERSIQRSALNSGFNLAVKLKLIDAASQFAEKLAEVDPANAAKLNGRLVALQKTVD